MQESFLLNQALASTDDISETVIDDYFSRLNDGEFVGVAELFSVRGILCPPFGKPICGRDAIARYLQTEAKGMESLPKSGIVRNGNDGDILYQIEGNVKTSFFTVNVNWLIHLNVQKEIELLEVRLLEKLQDLIAFK